MKTIVAAIIMMTPALGLADQIPLDKPITIAVIDTGFGFHGLGKGAKLCKYGHKDFSGVNKFRTDLGTKDPVPLDNMGHGTNVAGLIEQYANIGHANYCLVIVKYSDPLAKQTNNFPAEIKAFTWANKIHVDLINYSGGGSEFNIYEAMQITKFLDQGGILVAAAGNNRNELDGSTKAKWFPAMVDTRIVVVGSKENKYIEDQYLKGGELEGANWNVIEEMDKMREKFDKHGFFVLTIMRTDPDILEMDENEHLTAFKVKSYKVLIKFHGEVFIKSDSSNFGKLVNRWEFGGEQVAYGLPFSGTSQATAIATGKIVGELSRKLNQLGAQ
jgi:subtilisin family serine protease